MPTGVYKRTNIVRSQKWKDAMKKMIPWNKGKKMSDDFKLKASKSHIGIQTNEMHPNWKGDAAKVSAKHNWMVRKYGKPKYCEICKRTDKKQYDWSNKYHTYKRNREDWQRLCCSCHRDYDIKFNNYKKYVKK